jgi:hypothetical protein
MNYLSISAGDFGIQYAMILSYFITRPNNDLSIVMT